MVARLREKLVGVLTKKKEATDSSMDIKSLSLFALPSPSLCVTQWDM